MTMQRTLSFIIILFPLFLGAQHPRGSFSGKNYVLHAETEIVLKDGTKVQCKDKIDGVKIGKTKIDYNDVDYIRIIKAKGYGWKSSNETTYKYIIIKDQPQLVRILVESPKLSFYLERPIMTGGGYNGAGMRQKDGGRFKVFMVKDTDTKVHELDYIDLKSFVPKAEDFLLGKVLLDFFPDCPRLIQYYNNKKKRNQLSLPVISSIYNENCNEETLEDVKTEEEDSVEF